MFGVTKEINLIHGSPGSYPKNLSICFNEDEHETIAAFAGSNYFQVIKWDDKEEMEIGDPTFLKKGFGTDKHMPIIQVGLVFPDSRSYPLLIVCSATQVFVYDTRNNKPLHSVNLPSNLGHSKFTFARGITHVENTILVGTSRGDILNIYCSGETSFSNKKSSSEHKKAIMDLATCRFDLITISCDSSGLVCVWNKNFKAPVKRILTNLKVNVINILRKHAILGTLTGQVFLYNIQTGEMKVEVCTNARAISAISVAPESAYILIGGEDGVITVWKLHTRKPDPFQIEWRYNELGDSNRLLVGVDFANGREEIVWIEDEKPTKELFTNDLIDETINKINENKVNALDNATNENSAEPKKSTDPNFKFYKCRFCGLSFNYPTTLKAHERVHNVTMPYSCSKCDESFHYMCELEYHSKQHVDQKGYKCNCGRTFHTYTDMLYHKHDGEDYYLENPDAPILLSNNAPSTKYDSNQVYDDISQITASTYAQPKSGERMIEGLVPIKIPVPAYAVEGYEPKNPLKTYSETRSKPYICQYCSKAYTDSRSLTYHMYSHRGERSFNPRASRYLMSRTN
uniref:C2H2-type domain-containing protein n=1 Tax=Rhabditophanes sp. KR3021 TaxID=114890 RepID=A0AC35U5T0_9BILA